LSREYFIDDALGQRRIAESALPLNIGGKSQRGIVLPGVSGNQLAAYLAVSDGHVYIQPASAESPVFLNDDRLSDSAWLKSGDRVQIENALMSWTVKGDKVLIEVIMQAGDQSLRPPLHAPPDGPPTINNELPVRTQNIAPGNTGKRIRAYIIVVVSLLLLMAAYLLVATPVVIILQPQAQNVKMKGFPPPLHLWGSRLTLPGRYTIEAYQPGYAPLTEEVDIRMGETITLSYSLTELPGLLQISTDPEVELALQIDTIKADLDNAGLVKITRGPHQLRLESARYLPHEQKIEIEGYGKEQQLNIKLRPAWANISISSQPGAAKVRVDGEPIGQTPLTAPILQGRHKVELNLPGFKPLSATQEVEAGKDRAWEPFQMQAVDGKLSVSSRPDNASITLDGVFLGTSPMDLDIVANSAHTLRLSKSGYITVEQEITLQPDELRTLDVRLEAEYGTIFLSTYPADAKLLIDGKAPDKKSGRFQLSVRPHTFTLSKAGYATRKLTVTPRQGVSQNIEMKLKTLRLQAVQKKIAATPDTISGPTGQTLKFIKPDSSFTMGASRREAGRRANESRRLVELKRAFYFASKETTNHEYRLFKPTHRSGSLDGADLDDENQPVVNISWDDAARYCNWLSRKQGLPESYGEQNGKMFAVQPLTTGYRLPTEAEWAWIARRHLQATEQRYPWAGSYPPQKVHGNYADARIADTLADVVPDYDDGYRGSASVGSFPARPEGIYDLGGNVAEWMHDYYALYPGEASKLVIDPGGPGAATHHVVRGASWRHGNITELRLSYRDYSNKPRYDLGFRIARYAE